MEIKGRCLRATGFFPVRISPLESVCELGDVRGESPPIEEWFVEGEAIQKWPERPKFSTSEELFTPNTKKQIIWDI